MLENERKKSLKQKQQCLMRYMFGSWTFTTLTQRGFSPASLCEGFSNPTSPTGNPLQLVISVANDTL